jgi:hypothetical protein
MSYRRPPAKIGNMGLELLLAAYLWVLERIGRKRPVQCLFHCPNCRQIQPATKSEEIVYERRGYIVSPLSASLSLKCDKCHSSFDAESFKPGANNVLELKKWDCPSCGRLNPTTLFLCLHCGYKLL